MQNQTNFLGLLKEATDLIRDSRHSVRPLVRVQIIDLIRRDLIKHIPTNLMEIGLKPLEAIFLCIIATENDFCADAIRIFANFWSLNCEDSIRLQIFMSHSIHSGDLSKFIEIDERDRLKIKDGKRDEVLHLLIPKGFEMTSPYHVDR